MQMPVRKSKAQEGWLGGPAAPLTGLSDNAKKECK